MTFRPMRFAGLAALALGLCALGAHAGPDNEQARAEMQKAQAEVEKARAELQRATQELARSMSRVEADNPRVQYFAYMTDPKRAVLGVLIDDEVKDGEMRGVRLLAVTPGSGADKAGLKAGDLVLSLNGASLAGTGKESPPKKLRNALKTLKAGDSVKAEWEHDGKKMNGTIVTTAPEPELAMAPPPGFLDEWMHDQDFDKYDPAMVSMMPMFHFRGPAIRGLELAKIEDELGTYFKTSEGVLVIKAPKNGSLALKGGDVILKINGDAVSEPVTVLDKLRSRSDEQTVKLEIMRQGKKTELEGKIPVADAGMPRVYKYQEKRRRVTHGDDDKDSDDQPMRP
jgi:type II secretory pathway component PulC